VQTPGGSISRLVSRFPGLHVVTCDGTDYLDAYQRCGEAVSYARSGKGPALVHAHVVRLNPHSMSDDDHSYRCASELAEMTSRDPIRRLRTLLLEEGLANDEDLDTIVLEVETHVAEAADLALTHPQPPPEKATRWLYSEEVDPTSSDFDNEEEGDPSERREFTMVDLLNACLRDEMERDPRILVYGQDVADASRDILDEVSGKGGVFKVTHGLQRQFGSTRVFNSPLAEANIVGRAFGLAVRGLRPVVEIQFFDYIWPAFQQIRNEIATLRYRSGNGWSAPVVIRAPYGGYLKGGSIYHSQTGASIFAHTPGLHVILPSTAEDANGLLRTAIRCEDPVLFLEHKHLYRQIHNKGRYPGPEHMIPFGKGKIVRPGTDLTVVACGALVRRSMEAAKVAQESGIDVEVIDLRSIKPLDMELISESVKKTGKVLIAHEDALSWGIGSEIAALIADELFPWLDGPVRRVASKDVWVAYAPDLEEEILPRSSDVLQAIRELAAY
jgi:2-oxoisovalerate dehydrogenase E1 component